jgi:hypothetical protein
MIEGYTTDAHKNPLSRANHLYIHAGWRCKFGKIGNLVLCIVFAFGKRCRSYTVLVNDISALRILDSFISLQSILLRQLTLRLYIVVLEYILLRQSYITVKRSLQH